MLRITDHAASMIVQTRARRHLPEHYGVRVFSAASLDGQGPIQIGFSEKPFVGDEVSETEGARLFVAPEISGSVAGLVLDVEEQDDTVNFVLREA